MIHPSYLELMESINEGLENEHEPVITSRYSVVMATSKRARQLTNGAEPYVDVKDGKLLSAAIEEFYEHKVNIVTAPAPEEKELTEEEEAAAREQAVLEAAGELFAAAAEADGEMTADPEVSADA